MQPDETTPPKFLSACNVLIAANILVMILAALKSPMNLLVPDRQTLIEMGANFGVLTFTGEYWRLFTYMFLHVGVLHLGINMYGLRCVGPIAESLFGWRLFLVIYLFSGVVGALFSVLHDPLTVSAGASGAIFGAYGSLLALLYVQRDQYPAATLRYHAMLAAGLFIGNCIYGFFVRGLDNYAHFGGVLAGIFAGLMFANLHVSERRRVVYALPILLLVAGTLGGVTKASVERRGFAQYAAGIRCLHEHKYQDATDNFTLFIALNPQETAAYGSRALAYIKLDKLDLAAKDFGRVIATSPDSWEPYNQRAWIEIGLKQYKEAIEDATAALKLNPRSAATYDTRGLAYAQLGDTEKAFSDFAKGLQLDSKESACHYHRMKLYQKLGKLTEAEADKADAANYKPDKWEP